MSLVGINLGVDETKLPIRNSWYKTGRPPTCVRVFVCVCVCLREVLYSSAKLCGFLFVCLCECVCV